MYKKIISNEKENKTNLYSYNLKDDKENNNYLIDINNANISDNYEITKNELFSIIKPKKISYEDNIKISSDKYLTESFSTSFCSNKLTNKRSNNFNNVNKKNLLNLFNKNLDQDEFENIIQEKEDIIRELLGENGLDDIITCTNYKIIRKYDSLFYSIYNKKNNKN